MITTSASEEWFELAPWIDRPDASVDNFLKSRQKSRPFWTRFFSVQSFDLGAALSAWRNTGIVTFEQVVPHDLIDAYLRDVEHLRSNYMSYDVCIDIPGKQTYTKAVAAKELDGPGLRLNHMHTHSLAAAKLSLTREVCQFLAAIFDAAPTALQSLTFSHGSQQPIHVDYPYVNAQSRFPYLAASWIPLEDVHPDSGPPAYYPGGHKPEVSGFFDWGGGSITKQKDSPRNSMEFAQFLTERMEAARINPVTYCPRKGDVLISHANLPHEGTRINDSARTQRSLVTHYTASQFYPERWLPKGGGAAKATVSLNGGHVYDFPWSDPQNRLPSWKERHV